jgi:hypothetical protein
MEKTLIIKSQFDNSQFDQQIKQLEQRLNQVKKTSEVFTQVNKAGSPLGEHAKTFFGDYNKDSINKLREAFNLNSQKLMSESRDLQTKQKELSKLETIEKHLNDSQKERIKLLKEEIELTQKRGQTVVQEQNMIRNQATAMGGDVKDFGGGEMPSKAGAPAGGGMGGAIFKQLLKGISVNAVIQGALDAGRYVIERDRKFESEKGGAAALASRPLRQFYAGQGSDMQFWMPERQKAMQMAGKEQGRQGILDYLKIGGITGGGAAGGAIIGAAAGSFFPGLGTIAGGVTGGIMGALGGFGGSMMGSDRLKARLFDPGMYQAMQSKAGMEKYEQNLQSQQLQDPRRMMGREYWNENWQNLHGMQRTLGMGGNEFLGGPNSKSWLSQQIGSSGTTQENIQDTLSQIMGAGGTSQAGRQGTGIGARFGQRFFQDNAGSVMGRLSGAGIGQGMSGEGFDHKMEDSYKRLMSEAVKIGVDLSTMPKELERFTEITSQAIARTGNENVSSLISAAMPGTTQLAMQQGQTALQDFTARVGTGSGWEGQMGWSAMSKSANLSKLPVNVKQLLNTLPPDQITADNPLLQSAANLAGVDVDTIVSEMQDVTKAQVARTSSAEQALGKWGEVSKGKKGADLKNFIKTQEKGQYITAAAEQMASGASPNIAKNMEYGLSAVGLGASVLSGDAFQKAQEAPGMEARYKGDVYGGALAEEAKAKGTGQAAAADNMSRYVGEFSQAAKATTAASTEFNFAINKMTDAVKKGGDLLKTYNEFLESLNNKASAGKLINTDPIGKANSSGTSGGW